MIAEARPSFSAAIMPREPPRITMAVLMYNSGRTASLMEFAERRHEISEEQADQKRDDEPGLGRELERPGDAELLQVRRRGHRDVGPAAEHPAEVADPEYDGETDDEILDVGLERYGADGHDGEKNDVGEE